MKEIWQRQPALRTWISGAILSSKQIFLNVISNIESVRSEFLNSCFYSILFSTGDGQEAKKRFCGADRIDHMPPALRRAAVSICRWPPIGVCCICGCLVQAFSVLQRSCTAAEPGRRYESWKRIFTRRSWKTIRMYLQISVTIHSLSAYEDGCVMLACKQPSL